MRELNHLLRELDAPPGGLQRLQQAVETGGSSLSRRHGRIRLAAISGSAVAALLVAWYLPGMLATRQRTAVLLDAMQQTTGPGENGVRVHNGSALELPSGQADARVYVVETSTPPTP
jgi:hypothetical protein